MYYQTSQNALYLVYNLPIQLYTYFSYLKLSEYHIVCVCLDYAGHGCRSKAAEMAELVLYSGHNHIQTAYFCLFKFHLPECWQKLIHKQVLSGEERHNKTFHVPSFVLCSLHVFFYRVKKHTVILLDISQAV